MNHFLALSFKESSPADETHARIFARCHQAFRKLNPQSPPHELSLGSGLHAFLGKIEPSRFHQPSQSSFCYLASQPPCHTRKENVVDARALFDDWALSGGSAFLDLAPPFGGCGRTQQSDAIVAFADRCGLQYIYYWQGEGCALASSSCLLAGYVAKEALDEEALGLYSLVGNYLAGQSPFRGVRKLNPGCTCSLSAGYCEVISYLTGGDSKPSPIGSWDDAVSSGAEVLIQDVSSCLNAHQECSLELSGGLDSRLMLAAIPQERCAGVLTVTLGYPGSPDSRLAAQIARHAGMKHQPVDLSQIRGLSRTSALDLAKRASLECDHCSNPFSRAVLDWVNQQFDQKPRFSGQNGEFARGFYYAGQPNAPAPTRQLIESLIKWRIRANQSIDTGILADGYRQEIEEGVLRVIEGMFCGYQRGWLDSTDEFYFEGRMQRWVGADYSAASQNRTILAPFFNPSFIDWARKSPPSFKLGSRLAAATLERLDPVLARIPLDTGYNPRDLSSPSEYIKLLKRVDFLRKGTRKLLQKVSGRGCSPVGAEDLFRIIFPPGTSLASLVPRASKLAFIDTRALEEIEMGKRTISWVTLGFLLNLEWMLEFLDDSSHP
jgi:asparagine synthase (glutamine-hydrolysing)